MNTTQIAVDETSADLPLIIPDLVEPEKPRVTAVLVIHDGANFLPRTLDSIESQTRPPDVLIGVDAGSADDGLSLLRRATPHILQLARDTSFGDAVQAALTTLEGHALQHDPEPASPNPVDEDQSQQVEWLWLLHDDSAPAPDALELLLDVVDQGPSIGIAGCKQVSWEDSRRLLDVGFTTSPLGARVTGVDVGDIDQGQLDHRTDVLAVATSGMLVRRDVWERLGGPDPALSHARADLDLCRRAHLSGQRVVVVPGAVVAHAAATATGRRNQNDGIAYAVRDRRAALHLRLAAAPWFVVPFLVVWLAGAALIRAAGRLALKQPERAAGELLAFTLAMTSPLAWWRARRRVRSDKAIRRRDFRRLQAGPRQVVRQRRDSLAAYLRAQEEAWAGADPVHAVLPQSSTADDEKPLPVSDLVAVRSETALRAPREVRWDGDRSRAEEPRGATEGGVAGTKDDAELDDPELLAARSAQFFLRPVFGPDGELLTATGRTQTLRLAGLLALITLGAGVAGLKLLLSGTGQIVGPALLPMPASPSQLWHTALSGWRPVDLGAAAPGDPFHAVLALLAWPLGSSLEAATVFLLFGALPLSALGAWWAAGAVTRSRALRAWAAICWAASPSLLLAVAAGRLGAMAAHMVIPLAALALARTLGVARADPGKPRGGSITSSSAAGLALTVLIAAAPTLAVPVAAVLLIGLIRRSSRRGVLWAGVIPGVLLLPWWLAVAHTPQLLFSEPGGPSGTSAELSGASSWHLALWPIDPARLAMGAGSPAGSLAGHIARLLAPVVPAIGTAGVLRALACLLALPLLALAVSSVMIRPAAARWTTGKAARLLWLIALGAAGLALVMPLIDTGTGANSGTQVWPGALVSLITAAVIAAALGRLDGAAGRLRLRSAGWRHLGSVAFGVLAALMPLLVIAGWVADGWSARPASGWVHRGASDAVPAVAVAEAEGAGATRTLVLQVGPDGVRWVVYRSGGPRTGAWSAATALNQDVRSGRAGRPMLAVIGELLSDSGKDAREALADADIGSVVLLRDSDAAASQALDTAVGLTRVASTGQGLLWRVELDDAGGPTRPARARILSRSGAVLATLGSDGDQVSTQLEPGAGRVLVLAERADPGWRAWADGRRLAPRVHAGWAQAFALPAAGGHIRVEYRPPATGVMDGARLVIAAVALLGAVPLPIRRRRFLPPPARVRAAMGPALPEPRTASGRRAIQPEPEERSKPEPEERSKPEPEDPE